MVFHLSEPLMAESIRKTGSYYIGRLLDFPVPMFHCFSSHASELMSCMAQLIIQSVFLKLPQVGYLFLWNLIRFHQLPADRMIMCCNNHPVVIIFFKISGDMTVYCLPFPEYKTVPCLLWSLSTMPTILICQLNMLISLFWKKSAKFFPAPNIITRVNHYPLYLFSLFRAAPGLTQIRTAFPASAVLKLQAISTEQVLGIQMTSIIFLQLP